MMNREGFMGTTQGLALGTVQGMMLLSLVPNSCPNHLATTLQYKNVKK